MKRVPIPKQVRQKVYEKYNGHCAYCGDVKDVLDYLKSLVEE